jgi:chemotaxis signal transduction protein
MMSDQDSRISEVEFRVGARTLALPADRVTQVERVSEVVRAPGLPPVVIGIANIGGQALPVVDLRRAFGQSPASAGNAGETVVVNYGADLFALKVDQVLRVSTTSGGERQADQIEIDGVLDSLTGDLSTDATPAQALLHGPDEPAAARHSALPAKIANPTRQVAEAALAVETDRGVYYFPIEQIEALSDMLTVDEVPEPDPVFAGVAIHRSRAIPVLRLDRLLGHPASESAPAAFVVVSAARQSFAIAVKRIGGLTFDPHRRLSLPDLLAPFISSMTDDAAVEAAAEERGVQPGARYLLVELAGQSCALSLDEVDRVQGECSIIPAPMSGMKVAGLAAIGGAVLPLLDVAALLGLDHTDDKSCGYVVMSDRDVGSFAIPVGRLLRIVTIADAVMRPIAEDAALTAIAKHEGRTIWVLSAARLTQHAGWRGHAA